MAFLPSEAVLTEWTDMGAALTWAKIVPGVWLKVATALGDPELDNLALVGALPPDEMRKAITCGEELTPVLRTKLKLLYAAVRVKFGVPPVDCLEPPALAVSDPYGGNQGTAQADPKASSGGISRVRVATVLDQASDREVELLPPAELMEFRRVYRQHTGDAPLEDEEVTDAQLSALAQVVRAGGAPYADFGVWGPHGSRIAKQLRFTQHFLNAEGQWSSRELKGPDNFAAWERSWRVFRTASIMLGLATSSTLDAYAARFRKKVERYPWAWATCCIAEQRCRSEWWVQECRRQVDFHSTNAGISAFNEAMPWNSVLKAAAYATDFWKEHLEDECVLQKIGRGRSRSPRGPGGRKALPQPAGKGGGAGQNKKGAGGKDTRAGVRHRRTPEGKEICYAWSRHEDGCEAACPGQRAHCCEFCLGAHRTIACPKHPGWRPPSASGGASGGKGAKKRHL